MFKKFIGSKFVQAADADYLNIKMVSFIISIYLHISTYHL